MSRNVSTVLPIAATLLVLLTGGTRARASFVVTFTQVGPDVVASGTGSLNLSGLTASTTAGNTVSIRASTQQAYFGSTGGQTHDTYTGGTTFPTFGSGGVAFPASGSGGPVGVNGSQLYVPVGYVSGSQFSVTDTFSSSNFSSLGITPGTYSMTWSSDSFTIQVGSASVPEPSTWMLFGLSLAGLGFAYRKNAVRVPAHSALAV